MNLKLIHAICFAVRCVLAFSAPLAYADAAPPKKTVIHSQSELPTFNYKITTPTATALLDDEAALLALAEAQRKDAEATLAKYQIADKATLRDLYAAIRDAALVRGDAKSALEYSAKVRELGEKPSEKLTSGLRTNAAAAAMAAGGSLEQRQAAFQKAFAASINPLPWDVVRDDVLAWNGQFETPNMEAGMRGQIGGGLDPIVQQTGQISWDAARGLVGSAIYLRSVQPYVAQATSVLGEYIAANKKDRPDIWAKRAVTLDDTAATLTPVIVGVWDSGVDTSLFPGRLYSNAAEKLDGKDDDGNGFVDDIHGIGYDEDYDPATESRVPFDSKYPGRETELRELNIGRNDMQNGIDSPFVKVFQQRVSTLKAEEVPPLVEAAMFYSDYAHGTHVAGIAMDANPAARLMVVRTNFPSYKTKLPAFTPDISRRFAKNVAAIVDYMKSKGVRVVNMSWGEQLWYIEKSLEANGIGKNAEDRRKIALEAFEIEDAALTNAFKGAPEILFVASAGNANTDIGFDRAIPADIELPNVLAAGAVDQAGDEASFTSYGKRVRVYASGHQVESVVPGGTKMRMSGTSMAAPQVTNLAAKLFALNPKLTPTDVIKLILDGATKSADGKRLLINPKATVALLQAQQ